MIIIIIIIINTNINIKINIITNIITNTLFIMNNMNNMNNINLIVKEKENNEKNNLEILFFELIKRLNNKTELQLTNVVAELNDRIIMPLFIPSLVLLACFLIITNKEVINNNLLKIIIFTYGISLIIVSEILLDLSSKKIFASLVLYVSPLLFLIINWILLNYFLNRENIRS